MNLTRDEFCKQVFERDNYTCVVPGCRRRAADPHHIMERRLFTDGDPIPWGYHIDNGASLCELHHRHAEEGYFPPQALRRWLEVPTILPAICDPNKLYDKWGNEIPSAPSKHVKYPKTPYLNFSPGYESGDRYIANKELVGKPLAVTVKKDGSCVTLSPDVVGARNGTEARHPSFALLKQRHAQIKDKIPPGIQIFGEWLFARHSIKYEGSLALQDYLEVFAVYDQHDQLFLSQDDVADLCKRLDLVMVETVARVVYEAEWVLVQGIKALADELIGKGHEGVVVKTVYPHHYTQHGLNVAKYVRANHVQTDQHWSRMEITKNVLR
jgi:hypothetical protein